ncbi:MAG: hypothetical protein JKX70_04030 [Phycisphaerales bacterium]|nr:hypothetical protein [Phycisphaerales bacterium]
MTKTTVLALAVLAGGTTVLHAQVSTFSYSGEVIELRDDLGLMGAASLGSQGTGTFTLDFDAKPDDNPQGGGDFINFFEALGMSAVIEDFGISGVSPEDFVFAFAQDNVLIFEDEDFVAYDTLEIQLSVSANDDYDFGHFSINFIGTEDWFDGVATLPDPLSMGFENLLRAEVVIEFFQLQGGGGGDAPGDGDGGKGGVMVSSRTVINIGSMANAAGTVATIGCRSYQFAAPVAQFDFFDISSFITEFSAGSADADMNADGMLNFFDIAEFVAQVQTGCTN